MPYKGITFRSICSEDYPFLYEVYASTRIEELAPLNWNKDQLDSFLQMQFTAQHKYYQEHYAKAAFDIILLIEQAIGRLYVDRWEKEIRIVDIALLPEFRNKGVGRAILEDILAEGAATGKSVSIHVEKLNPALPLYKRLGFRQVDDVSVYYLMKWSPNSQEGASPEDTKE